MAARLNGALVFAGAGVLLIAALLVGTAGELGAIVACVLVAALVGLVVVGLERAAVIALVVAFATAPAYRGLEGLTGGVATPADILVVVAALLLLPGVVSRPLEIPAPFVLGLVVVALFGLAAGVLSDTPAASLFALIQWLFFLGALPIMIAWWRPGTTTIVTLLWAYVAGQMASTAYALATGPVVGNRYQGLAHHTNAFGMAGMAAIAILLYLFVHHRSAHMRVVVLGAGAVSAASIVMSGSRAALVVAVVLLLMVPVVERSAISGFVLGVFGALGLIAFPILVQSGHGGSALSRLAGQGTAASADQARNLGLEEGFRRLRESPVLGSGLGNVEVIHNVFLEVAVGIGVIGLVGYLVALFVLSRPLVTDHPHRRLSYLPIGFVGMAPALPGIWDRTMWVPISLAILAVVGTSRSRGPDADEAQGEGRTPVPVGRRARQVSS